MNYGELNSIFLAVSLVVFFVALLLRPNRRKVVVAVVLTIVVLSALTAVFDNIMIASGLFDYGGDALNGVRLGLAPLEDFAYPIAAALLLPGLWLMFAKGPHT